MKLDKGGETGSGRVIHIYLFQFLMVLISGQTHLISMQLSDSIESTQGFSGVQERKQMI